MLASTLLVKKRQGHSLADDEIRFLVDGFCSGEVTDYQMSAFAMAICVRGMNARETTALTQAMLESGDRLPREPPHTSGRKRVCKHSTGGLGDMVSLILAPLLAACELEVPMISGRGLGLTGGTLDKLESIAGFRTDLSIDQSNRVLREVGAFIVGAGERIAPADRELYALRDVTGTVESIPLITASILSKKLAANLDALAMDVKVGSGAFMKTEAQATELAESLVSVGQQLGLSTSVILSDMHQPLGRAIGNAVEVNDAMEVLDGRQGAERELTIELCADLLVQVDAAPALGEARRRLAAMIDRGFAMERFQQMVRAQGGRLDGPLALAPAHIISAPRSGFIVRYDCEAIGELIVKLGGGRRRKGDPIDHRIGIKTHGRIGDRVEKGAPVFTLHCHRGDQTRYLEGLAKAIEVQEVPAQPHPLVLQRIGLERHVRKPPRP